MAAHEGSTEVQSSIPYPEDGRYDKENFAEADGFAYGDSHNHNSLLARSLRLVLGNAAGEMPRGDANPYTRRLKGLMMNAYIERGASMCGCMNKLVNIGDPWLWSSNIVVDATT